MNEIVSTAATAALQLCMMANSVLILLAIMLIVATNVSIAVKKRSTQVVQEFEQLLSAAGVVFNFLILNDIYGRGGSFQRNCARLVLLLEHLAPRW